MTQEHDLVGQVLLGKLEVIRKLGGGGMGEVYEVEHRLTGHRRALKVVLPQFADRPRFMKRLLREAKVAGTLDTDHVVETYDAGRLEDGSAYILMELLRGRSMFETMEEDGPFEPRRLAQIMAQVAEGMAMAHEAGIVHRDLKPENIFLLREQDGTERVKILDFGVSKFEPKADEAPSRLTAEGTLVGTPYYMAPEQAAGKTVDARTDVYAMGVMIYEALTGRLPFEADSVGELFVKIGAGEYTPLEARCPGLDARWYRITHRAFHRDPRERFQNAEDLRRELLVLLQGGATAARARTISDGARATLGFDDPLPPPPRAPTRSGNPVDAGEDDGQDDADLEADALEGPPPSSGGAGAGRKMPGWGWAALGAAVVLAVLVPWQLASRGQGSGAPAAGADGEASPAAASAPVLAARGESDEPAEAGAAPGEDDRGEAATAGSVAAAADGGVRGRAARAEDRGQQDEEPRSRPTGPAATPARPSSPSSPGSPSGRNRATAAGLDPNPYR